MLSTTNFESRFWRDADGELAQFWQLADDAWSPRAWHILDGDEVQAGRDAGIQAVIALLAGDAIEVRGSLLTATAALQRVWRVLRGTTLNRNLVRALETRCFVRLRAGEPVAIPTTNHENVIWLREFEEIVQSSNNLAYVPAQFLSPATA